VRASAKVVLQFAVHPFIEHSLITESSRLALMVAGLIPFDFGTRTYELRDLTVNGQSIPNLEVRVYSRLTSPDGLLGNRFLRNYREVHYSPASQDLTLIDP
jgi:hypothetical protein